MLGRHRPVEWIPGRSIFSLSDEQAAGFGGFPDEESAEDLERFGWLDDTDLSVVGAAGACAGRADHDMAFQEVDA
ncbi:hypothetical protein ACTXM3_18170 [Glutamicibacter arilaitensis]